MEREAFVHAHTLARGARYKTGWFFLQITAAGRRAAMSDDEEQEVEEDPRITKLYSFADKRSDEDGKYGKKGDTSDIDGEAFATLLDEVGTDNAIVLGGMWMGEASLARAYFTVAALIDADEVTIDKCVELKRIALKAVVKKGLVAGVHLLAALERYATNEAEDKAACLKTWKKVLQYCWEYEIVAEEDIRAWNEDERAAAKLQVQAKDAQKLREKSLAFFEWLEQGE